MYAIEFEADIKDNLIKIPEHENFAFEHVKVIVMADTSSSGNQGIKKKELASFFDLAENIEIDISAIDDLRKKSLI